MRKTIARPDGDVAWLDRPRTAGDDGMGRFYRSIDTVLMGRKTYELGRALGQDAYPGKKNYVFSRRAHVGAAGITVVAEDIAAFAGRLRRSRGTTSLRVPAGMRVSWAPGPDSSRRSGSHRGRP